MKRNTGWTGFGSLGRGERKVHGRAEAPAPQNHRRQDRRRYRLRVTLKLLVPLRSPANVCERVPPESSTEFGAASPSSECVLLRTRRLRHWRRHSRPRANTLRYNSPAGNPGFPRGYFQETNVTQIIRRQAACALAMFAFASLFTPSSYGQTNASCD